jgi:hypothetical protein
VIQDGVADQLDGIPDEKKGDLVTFLERRFGDVKGKRGKCGILGFMRALDQNLGHRNR